MNDERWGELIDQIENRFGEIKKETQKETHEDDVGHKTESVIEILEFNSELGELKVERITRPKVLDKKSHYHHGGVAKVEYIVSDTEMSHKINVYKKDEAGNWQPLDLPAERLNF